MRYFNERRLINKQYKSYDKLSRYAAFPYYYDSDNDRYVYGTTAYLRGDALHLVDRFDTWDSLASYYYNNPTYYWVLCSFNRVQDPFQDPEIGTFIKIPSFSEIKFIV